MFIPRQLRKGQLLAFMEDWRTQTASAPAKPSYAMDLGKFEAVLTRRFGSAGSAAYKQWRNLRTGLATAADRDKLSRVNDFFNRRSRHMDHKRGHRHRQIFHPAQRRHSHGETTPDLHPPERPQRETQ